MRLGGAVGMVADDDDDDDVVVVVAAADADYMQYRIQYCTLMCEDLWWDSVFYELGFGYCQGR